MKPEAQRIAIAEACGWDGVTKGCWGIPPEGRPAIPIPFYLTDLNAMHEAEKTLRGMQWHDYVQNLKALLCDDAVVLIHATAAQRAEAILKTLNLWDPTK